VQKNGLVLDFVVLKRIVKKQVLDKLDHYLLNDIIKNPSAERVVMWIWDQLKDLQKILKAEMDDPNLGAEIKALLKKSDRKGALKKAEFDKALRLCRLQLWETATSSVTYRGE